MSAASKATHPSVGARSCVAMWKKIALPRPRLAGLIL